MDLNPLFTSPSAFRPAGDGGALKLFEQARIQLVHGWLVDPESPDFKVLAATEDYDNCLNIIVAADHLTKGQFVVDDSLGGPSAVGPSSPIDHWSAEEQKQVEDGKILQIFITAL